MAVERREIVVIGAGPELRRVPRSRAAGGSSAARRPGRSARSWRRLRRLRRVQLQGPAGPARQRRRTRTDPYAADHQRETIRVRRHTSPLHLIPPQAVRHIPRPTRHRCRRRADHVERATILDPSERRIGLEEPDHRRGSRKSRRKSSSSRTDPSRSRPTRTESATGGVRVRARRCSSSWKAATATAGRANCW